jgi:hypothetical protein
MDEFYTGPRGRYSGDLGRLTELEDVHVEFQRAIGHEAQAAGIVRWYRGAEFAARRTQLFADRNRLEAQVADESVRVGAERADAHLALLRLQRPARDRALGLACREH